MSDTTTIVARRRFSNDDLRSITDFKSAANLALQRGPVIDISAEFGSGFDVLPTDQKGTLVGVEFVVLEWHFSEGDNGEFVSAIIVTADGRKLILNDGGTGICAQFRALTDRDIDNALYVKRGLRASVFYYTGSGDDIVVYKDAAPGRKRGVTYYLAF